MKVTAEIKDYSKQIPLEQTQLDQPSIKVHSCRDCGFVELDIEGRKYKVSGKELISAVDKCTLDFFGT